MNADAQSSVPATNRFLFSDEKRVREQAPPIMITNIAQSESDPITTRGEEPTYRGSDMEMSSSSSGDGSDDWLPSGSDPESDSLSGSEFVGAEL